MSMNAGDLESLRRRLQAAGDARYLAERLFGSPLTRGMFSTQGLRYAPRVIDLTAVSLFDIVESLRRCRIVDHFGDPRPLVLEVDTVLEQHPRFLSLWNEERTRSTVGLHLGVDLLHGDDGYYIVEVNLDAALSPDRRALYDTRVDPVMKGIAEHAQVQGYSRLVLAHRSWSDRYLGEFEALSEEHSLEVVGACSPYLDRQSVPMAVLPTPLDSDTLYVFFRGRHSVQDYLLHDKEAVALWLGEALTAEPDGGVRVKMPRTSRHPFVPDIERGVEFPNLVAKMSGADRGKSVLMGRFTDVTQIREVLGLSDHQMVPLPFRRSLRQRIERCVLAEGEAIYQEFVPPSLDESRRPFIYRVHFLLTPSSHRYLSSHRFVSPHAVPPEPLAPGTVDEFGRFLVKRSHGADYASTSAEEVAELSTVVEHLAPAVRRGIADRFRIRS